MIGPSDRPPFAVSRQTPAAGAPVSVPGASDQPAVSAAGVRQALGTVFDPDLGMSIVELGLVYDIHVRDRTVSITMTLTAPGCPLHDVMPEWVRRAALGVPGVEHVDVILTFEPPWTPERIQRRA